MSTVPRESKLRQNRSKRIENSGKRYDLRDAFPWGYSRAFGDADIMPSTNIVASWWPAVLSPSRDLLFDAQLVEVTREKAVAWALSVYGHGAVACDADGDAACYQAIDRGWKIYAAERFYDGPLLFNATLVRTPGAASAALGFVAHSAFKRDDATAGTWALEDGGGATVAAGAFSFAAHWRASAVTAAVGNATAAALLRVRDEYGREATAVPASRAGG